MSGPDVVLLYAAMAIIAQAAYERAWRRDRLRPTVDRIAFRLGWSRSDVVWFFSIVTAVFWPVSVPASVYWTIAHRVRGSWLRRHAGRGSR